MLTPSKMTALGLNPVIPVLLFRLLAGICDADRFKRRGGADVLPQYNIISERPRREHLRYDVNGAIIQRP